MTEGYPIFYGSQEYQSWTKPTSNIRLTANQMMRNSYFSSTRTIIILQNTNNKKDKLKKKNITKRNTLAIYQVVIVNQAVIPKKNYISMTRNVSLSG